MKTSLLKSLLMIGLAWLSVGCSTQYREASPQLSSEDLSALFTEIAEGGQVAGASIDELEGLTITGFYHAMSDSNRPAYSVLSANEMGFLDATLEGYRITDLDIEKVDVLFVDGYDGDEERRFALMIRLELYEGEVLYFSSMTAQGDYEFTDDSFTAQIEDATGEMITITTNDVHPDNAEELDNAAHLELWKDFGSGEEFIGQVSTMAGYEN